MSSTFCYYCLVFSHCLIYYLFIYLKLLVSGRYRYVPKTLRILRARLSRLWAAASGRARHVTLNYFVSICFLSLVYTKLHALIGYLSLQGLELGFLWLVALLSPAVLSCHTSLSIFIVKSLACVECWECWSSICCDVRWSWWGSMLWFEQCLERWGRLRPSQFVVSHAQIC
jgi:hypothetical protein